MVGEKASRGRDFRKECWSYGVKRFSSLEALFCIDYERKKKGVNERWVPPSTEEAVCNVRYYS